MAVKRINKIIEIELSAMDYALILKVKELRLLAKISQEQLSIELKRAAGFVSKVENLTQRDKYNIGLLPFIAKALNRKISELFPDPLPTHEFVKVTLNRKNRINNDGTISSKTEVVILKSIPIIPKP